MGQVIHSQAGKLAAERRDFTQLQHKLQGQLATYQRTCEQQQREITTLRGIVGALEKMRNGMGAAEDEVAEMQTVLEAWQAQAMEAQKELTIVSEKYRALNHKHIEDQARIEQLQRAKQDVDDRDARAGVDAATLQGIMSKLETMAQEAERWREAHRQLDSEHEALKQEKLASENRAKHLEQLAGTLEHRVGDLETQNLDAQRLNAKLATDVKQLLTQCECAQEAAATGTAASTEQLDTLRRECDSRIEMLMNEHDTHVESLRASHESHTSLLGQLQRLHTDLEQTQRDAKDVVSEKVAVAHKWQSEAETLRKNVDAAASRVAALQKENHALADTLRAQDKQRSALEDSHSAGEARISELEQELKVRGDSYRVCDLPCALSPDGSSRAGFERGAERQAERLRRAAREDERTLPQFQGSATSARAGRANDRITPRRSRRCAHAGVRS